MGVKEKFIETILEYGMIKKGDKVVAGVSGGPDSVCLLHLLWRFKDELGISLSVAHLDHMFRGQESKEDAIFVKALCEKWGLCFFYEENNVPAYIEKTGYSPEDAARRVRYDFYEKVKRKVGAHKVALGHNKNDHEETVIMNILRGSGIEGLIGIEPVRDCYIRPLLKISRQEIEEYLENEGIDYRIDSTNLTGDYFRNRLRLELIPLIEQKYCPHLGISIRRLSEIAAVDLAFIEQVTKKAANDAVKIKMGEILFNIQKFLPLHKAIKRRLVRMAVKHITGDIKDFDYVHTNMMIDFIEKASTGSIINLPKDLIGEKGYEYRFIGRKKPETVPEYCYELSVPGAVSIKEAKVVIKSHVEVLPSEHTIQYNPLIARLDYDKIKGKLFIRNRRPGDRFYPLGFMHFKKLQDFFTDEKIPKSQRDKVPLVVCDGNIAWVGGIRIDDRYKITGGTRHALYLKMERQED